MRRIITKQLLFLFLLSVSTLSGQFLQEPFNAGLNNWTPNGSWGWNANGAADTVFTADWRGRTAIRSFSEGGTALFANPEQDAQLLSPTVDIPGGTSGLFLSFYQYIRSNGGQGRVIIRDGGGIVLREIELLPELTPGEETSSGDYRIIDLTDLLPGLNRVQVEFDVEGGLFFWLLDDVRLSETRPPRPTFPRSVGQSLEDYGIPFVVDSAGGAAVPYQLVLDFMPSISQAERDNIRMQLGAARVQSCVCDRLELWELPGGNFFDPVSGEVLGDPGDILERVLGGGSSGTIDEVELNYYNFNELQNQPPAPAMPLTAADISSFSPAPAGAINIAILDTGLDYDHPDLAGYVFRSDDGIGDGGDQDGNCNVDDPMGWNYVDDNNNPQDDHSHGTHIAGVIAETLADCDNCDFRIIPYKTHNSYGVGTLFAASCGVLQAAVQDNAAVINASWGFYGGGGTILRNAIDTAGSYGALVLAAVGNDSLNLIADQQNPATTSLNNVVGVGAYFLNGSAEAEIAPFSNFNASFVDLLAQGVEIESSVPGGGRGLKSGTSMATPAVTAVAALYTCENGKNTVATKNYLLSSATKEPGSLGLFVLDGNLLKPAAPCDEEPEISRPSTNTGFGVSFDGTTGNAVLTAFSDLQAGEVSLLGKAGNLIAKETDVFLTKGSKLSFSLDGQPDGGYLMVVRQGDRVRVESLVKR
ncbi:S8 family serine peptidase [Neolewinella agarilytica]|uniref:S8 family serine peptidase n=1 Tax=Neolewinella agarilytica TaxID=478744 RepID=UPI002354C0F5|nr:S8 family serine peptidase [Neolewinella agarilytica]